MANSKIVMGIDDLPMWQSIDRQRLALQCCDACATFRYPPAPLCPTCLLQGPQPEDNWIGREVVFAYAEHAGRMQHHVRLAGETGLADAAVGHDGPGGDLGQNNGA